MQIENENKLDPAGYDPSDRAEDDLRKSRLLVTLLQYMQNLKDIDNKGPPPKNGDLEVIWSYLVLSGLGFKEAGLKRWMVGLNNKPSSKLMPRWKIKKG